MSSVWSCIDWTWEATWVQGVLAWKEGAGPVVSWSAAAAAAACCWALGEMPAGSHGANAVVSGGMSCSHCSDSNTAPGGLGVRRGRCPTALSAELFVDDTEAFAAQCAAVARVPVKGLYVAPLPPRVCYSSRNSPKPAQRLMISSALSLLAALVLMPAVWTWMQQDMEARDGALLNRIALASLAGLCLFLAHVAALQSITKATGAAAVAAITKLRPARTLPFALIVGCSGIRVSHLLGTALVCVGGILPGTEDPLALLLQPSIWCKAAAWKPVLIELFVGAHHVLLHQVVVKGQSNTVTTEVLLFVVVTRAVHGLLGATFCLSMQSMRKDSAELLKSKWTHLSGELFAEGASLAGLLFLAFANLACPSPAAVDAVETSIRQLIDWLCAAMASWGPAVCLPVLPNCVHPASRPAAGSAGFLVAGLALAWA